MFNPYSRYAPYALLFLAMCLGQILLSCQAEAREIAKTQYEQEMGQYNRCVYALDAIRVYLKLETIRAYERVHRTRMRVKGHYWMVRAPHKEIKQFMKGCPSIVIQKFEEFPSLEAREYMLFMLDLLDIHDVNKAVAALDLIDAIVEELNKGNGQ